VEFVEIFKLAVVREESHANSHMIFPKSTRSGRSQKTMSQGNDKEMKLGKEKVFPTPPHPPPPTPASTPTKLEVIMTIILILRNNIKYRLLTN